MLLPNSVNGLIRNLVGQIDEFDERLIYTTQALQALKERQAKFVSELAHELRTPVANLITSLYLMEHDETDRQSHLESTKRQLDRLRTLLDHLLDDSCLETMQGPPRFDAVDLNDLIAQSVETYQARASVAGLALRFMLFPNLPPVRGEQYQLAQVIGNLLSNAIKYTRQGRVMVSTWYDGTRHLAVLTVEDTGMGIAEADLPRLCERFFRAERVRRSNIPGTGLGLHIIKDIVSQHEGRMEIESELDRGSRFTVWLPCLRSPEPVCQQ